VGGNIFERLLSASYNVWHQSVYTRSLCNTRCFLLLWSDLCREVSRPPGMCRWWCGIQERSAQAPEGLLSFVIHLPQATPGAILLITRSTPPRNRTTCAGGRCNILPERPHGSTTITDLIPAQNSGTHLLLVREPEATTGCSGRRHAGSSPFSLIR
jgi:hypothetical protein